MHRITRTLTDGTAASRDFHGPREAEDCFTALTLRQDVTRVTWHEGSAWDQERKVGGWKLVQWANGLLAAAAWTATRDVTHGEAGQTFG